MPEYCANHPNVETRVHCAECGKPICTECMNQTPVGMKCAECSRLSRGQIRRGKPEQYIAAAAAGIGTALVGGFAATVLLSVLPFGSIILGVGLGYLIGTVVKKGAKGNRGGAFVWIAAGSGLLGGSMVGLVFGFGFYFGLFGLIYLAAPAVVAALMLRE